MNGSAHNRFPDVEAGRGAAAQRTGGKRAKLVPKGIAHAVTAPREVEGRRRGGEPIRCEILDHPQREQVGGAIPPFPACGLTFFSDHPFSIYGTPVERAVKDNEPASGKGRADRLPDRPVE